jgi:monoamine oxidase
VDHRSPVVSRRSLLAAVAAGSVAAALPRTSATACSRGPSVVVVGAGLAGIAAAERLRRLGYEVRVVEARNRVGGRVHSWRGWPDTTVDLGASWIHGYAAGNPITPIARRAGAHLTPSSYSSGRLHIDPELSAAGVTWPHNGRWGRLVRQAERRALARSHDQSLAAAVRQRVAGLELDGVEKDLMAFYLNANYTTEWGADPDELSAWTVDEGKEYGPTGEDAFFRDGYDQVTRYLARRLRIDTGVVVRRVALRRRGVEVHTNAGTIAAQAVVVTVPLGVLKQQAITFEPGLPVRHEQAIDRLGMGVLSKTFLRFDEPFWPVHQDWQEYLGPRRGAWAEWFSMAKAGPPVILCFHGGDRARALEKASPHEVRGEAMEVLRTMYGRHIPEPLAVRTTRWSLDPFAHGSYSTNAVGSTRGDRVALGRPVEDRLFFAGEATEPDYSSTVHGAYLSGLRAAHDVHASITG